MEGDTLPAALDVRDRRAAQAHVIGDVRLAKLSPRARIPQASAKFLVDPFHNDSLAQMTWQRQRSKHVYTTNSDSVHHLTLPQDLR